MQDSIRNNRNKITASGGIVLLLLGLFLLPLGARGEVGGGGSVGGSSGESANHFWLYTYDNPDNPQQGWDGASINHFLSKNPGAHNSIFRNKATRVCNTALTEARQRTGTQHARVVQLGVAMVDDPQYPYAAGATSEFWQKNYAYYWPSAINSLVGYRANAAYQPYIQKIHDVFVSHIRPNADIVCVALAENEPPRNYQLEISTKAQAGAVQVGGKESVTDAITAYADTAISEEVTGKILLNWDSYPAQGTAQKQAQKDFTIANKATKESPEFTPADFGWEIWPAGRYWFDIQIPQQGHMAKAVDTADRNAHETWNLPAPAPQKELRSADGKASDFQVAANMSYQARITGMGMGDTTTLILRDEILAEGITIGTPQVVDQNGKAVPAEIKKEAKSVVATIHPQQVGNYTLIVPQQAGASAHDYSIPDQGSACWDKELTLCQSTEIKETKKVTPQPDKAWVLDINGALQSYDPEWSNAKGADRKLFLHGDSVGAVVNGKIRKNLASPLTSYSLVDDWREAARFVDFTDTSQARVFYGNEDVTAEFSIQTAQNITTAQALPAFLARTAHSEADVPVKLYIAGKFRPLGPDTDTNNQVITLHNNGWEIWNSEKIPTNNPPVFIWNGKDKKDVLAAASQGGDQSSIAGQAVFPGQILEYLVDVDLQWPAEAGESAYALEKFAVRDTYDKHFQLEKESIEFYDTRTNKAIPRSAYELTFNDERSEFTATFTEAWIKDNLLNLKKAGALLLRFTGKTTLDVTPGSQVANQAFIKINNQVRSTDIPRVHIPLVEPNKEDLNTQLADIDGKVLVQGDTILYRLRLDARPARAEIAYDVHKLGMIDDFDEDYLTLDAKQISVVNKATGATVTEKFTIQIKDGKAYIFAKTVAHKNNAGETIAAEDSNLDLATYAQRTIDPLASSIIDQELLGQEYFIYIPAQVKKAKSGYTIKNSAQQNIENMQINTPVVANPLQEINPQKDVNIEIGGKSLADGEIEIGKLFNYRLSSAILPAERGYAAESWNIHDDYAEQADHFSGTWVMVAARDLYAGEKRLAQSGEIIAQQKIGSECQSLSGYACFLAVEDKNGVIEAHATADYLELVNSRPDLEQGFDLYLQMERIRPGQYENTFQEIYNGVPRQSNTVRTTTPEKLEISVEKYDTESGLAQGDRDSASAALEIPAAKAKTPVPLSFQLTNTGNVELQNITVTDRTLEGSGEVEKISCPRRTLDAGESIICQGELRGLEAGNKHHDRAKAQGESPYSGKVVTVEDDWHARIAADNREMLEKTGIKIGGMLLGAVGAAGGGIFIRRKIRKAKEL